MAQEIPEIAAGNALVVDANILLRAVLGIRVRTLIERYVGRVRLPIPNRRIVFSWSNIVRRSHA